MSTWNQDDQAADETAASDIHHPDSIGDERLPESEEHAKNKDRGGQKPQEKIDNNENGAAHRVARL